MVSERASGGGQKRRRGHVLKVVIEEEDLDIKQHKVSIYFRK